MQNIILVDFFDTVMFREIHSWQLIDQWIDVIKKKYNISPDLRQLRSEAIKSANGNVYEMSYRDLILYIYNHIYIDDKFEEFYDFCYKAEVYVDLATQYPNKRIINKLREEKNSGKKIYIVTDYILPQSSYYIYLDYFELTDLFDGIFCSETYGKSKINGTLYQQVLQELKVSPERVLMIGDSKKADYLMAKKNNIRAIWYRPYLHKIKTNIRRFQHYDFRKHVISHAFHFEYKRDYLGDYSLQFYYFEEKLYEFIKSNGQEPYFMARGGYLLKQLFDEYSNWGNREVSSKYLKISRLVIREAKEDESKKMLLKNYLIQNGLNFKNMCFVDEGWNCSSQIDLTDMFDGKSIGYYFGTFKNKNIHNSSFNGILFSGDGDCIANYEGVFRANLTFIEQICTAPNGSVVGYEESGGKIDAIEKVIDIEKNLYERYTTDIQKIIATNFKMLCAWAPQLNKKKLAYYALKTGLNGEKNIVEKLKYFDNHKYVNVLGNRAINSIDRLGKVKKIIITDVMARPCLYFRYFSKVRLLAMRNRWIQVFYPLIKKVLEVYVSIFIAMERKK